MSLQSTGTTSISAPGSSTAGRCVSCLQGLQREVDSCAPDSRTTSTPPRKQAGEQRRRHSRRLPRRRLPRPRSRPLPARFRRSAAIRRSTRSTKLRLQEAHSLTKGSNILVAVIDSGIDAGHPELRGVIAGTFDALGKAEKPHAHGTAMAGTIAARSRLMGVTRGARILAIRAFSPRAWNSGESTTYHILRGLDHAVANNVRIIDVDFAGPRRPVDRARAGKAAYDKGVVLIAAAGNAGPRGAGALYPAADPHVIAVTATDVDDHLSHRRANRGNHVAIAAPGVDILVPAPSGDCRGHNRDLRSRPPRSAAWSR